MPRGAALQAHLAEQVGLGFADANVADTIHRIATAATQLSVTVARGSIQDDANARFPIRTGGDIQKAIDRCAHKLLRDAMLDSAVAVFVSEEADEADLIHPKGSLCVAIDHVDGSGNVDLNVPFGTIFSIAKWPAETRAPGADHDAFSWPLGTAQLAAGFVLYGPQTTLILTTGSSVDLFTLDPDSRQFTLTQAAIRIPSAAPDDYAVNASNYRHWDEPIRSYIDELVAGAAGPYGRDFNMRWHGALVAEAHRIIGRGGLYLYPADAREGHRNGRLRLIYEAYPIAFLVECAGGAATNGGRRILDIEAHSLHQRVPLVFGSKSMVDRLMALHHRPGLWPPSVAPLFATRGLFRS